MHLRSPSILRFLPALLVASSAFVAQAQVTTGSLVIDIKDRITKDPLKDATVVLTSPALFKERVIKSDAHGQVRALLLPVGNYKVTVSQDGFLSAIVEDVRIGVGANMAQIVNLAPLSTTVGMITVTTIAASFDVNGGVDFDDPAEETNN